MPGHLFCFSFALGLLSVWSAAFSAVHNVAWRVPDGSFFVDDVLESNERMDNGRALLGLRSIHNIYGGPRQNGGFACCFVSRCWSTRMKLETEAENGQPWRIRHVFIYAGAARITLLLLQCVQYTVLRIRYIRWRRLLAVQRFMCHFYVFFRGRVVIGA